MKNEIKWYLPCGQGKLKKKNQKKIILTWYLKE
jgi:hypothetical protein